MYAYANANSSIGRMFLPRCNYDVISFSSKLSPVSHLPGVAIYEPLKNFDDDPITSEEEKDLLASHNDYLSGKYVSFSSDVPRETIIKFLDDL